MNTEMFPLVAIANEDKNRRYTREENVRWIEQRFGIERGDWHLDPAADDKSHHSPRWFSLLPYEGSAGVNGLEQSWLPTYELASRLCRGYARTGRGRPHQIFANFPWSDLSVWHAKLWREIHAHWCQDIGIVIADVLPGDRHEQDWWQRFIEPFRLETRGDALAPRSATDENRVGPCGFAACRCFKDVELRVHCPPERWEYDSPGGGSKDNAFFPSIVVEFRSDFGAPTVLRAA